MVCRGQGQGSVSRVTWTPTVRMAFDIQPRVRGPLCGQCPGSAPSAEAAVVFAASKQRAHCPLALEKVVFNK